jgi:hypothetical protein
MIIQIFPGNEILKKEALPGFEPGLPESEPDVITIYTTEPGGYNVVETADLMIL